MDRFQLLDLDSGPAAEPEEIVKANGGRFRFEDGARASGNVRSARSLLGQADLDWDPEFRDLWTEGPSCCHVPDSIARAVVRSDNKIPIGVVGARYALIPHRRLADLADALCGANDQLRYGNAGHKHNGARPFLQLKGEPRKIGQDVRGADVDVSDVITLLTSHDGTLKTMACYSAKIIVCDNTYAHALSCAQKHGIDIRHTASGARTIDEAIRIASEASKRGLDFDNTALRLMTRAFDDQEMRALVSALIPGESTRSENERSELLRAWVQPPGAAPGSAWGAAQAVTWWTTHDIPVRGETDRAFGLATGEGRGADVQASAWWYLTTEEGAKALQTVKLQRC